MAGQELTGGRRGLLERLGSGIFGHDGHDGRALSPDQWAYRWTRWDPAEPTAPGRHSSEPVRSGRRAQAIAESITDAQVEAYQAADMAHSRTAVLALPAEGSG